MKQLDLTKGSTRKLFIHYLLPSISATLVTSIYVLADTIMIGKGIGPDGIAALNIVLPIFTLFYGIGLLFGVGGAVLMSVAQGANDYDLGKKYFTTSTISNAVMSIILLINMHTFLSGILRTLGATDVTFELAKEYSLILVSGAPIFMFSSMLQAFVRNDKNPTLAMVGVISGGVTNIILDYIFIYICKWSMSGGAIATVIGSTVTVTILSAHFFRKSNTLKLVRNGFSLQRLVKIATNGFSSFLVEMANGVVTFLFNIQLVKYIGDIGITVYSIIANSSIVVMSLANGVAQAAQPIFAVNFGARQKKRVSEVRRLGMICTAIIGAFMVALGVLFPEMITRIFIHATDEILALAVPAIRVYFTAFIFVNLNIFGSNYFQSVMQPQFAMVITLLRGIFLSCGLVLLLPVMFGANGIWLAIPIAEALTFAVVAILLVRDKKQLG